MKMKFSAGVLLFVSLLCASVLPALVAAQPRLVINHAAQTNRFTKATLTNALANTGFTMSNITNIAYTSVTGLIAAGTCGTWTMNITLFSHLNGTITGALGATPFTASIADTAVCNVTAITFRGLVGTTAVATVSNTTVFPGSQPQVINQPPIVNAFSAPAAAVVRTGAQVDHVIGTGLPNLAGRGAAVLKLESVAGGLCANITTVTLGGTAVNASMSYTLSSTSDGCRLYLDTMNRIGFAATGSGVTNKTNTIRYLVAGSPVVTAASPPLLYRTTQTITLTGTNLPKGPAENPIISLTTTNPCVATTIACPITSYGAGTLTCLADLRSIRGNDTRGGCLVGVRITRLGVVANSSPGLRCPDIPVPTPPTSGAPFQLNFVPPQGSLTVPQLNSALNGATLDFPTPSILSLRNCSMFLNVSKCAIGMIPISLSNCAVSNGRVVAQVPANAVPAIDDSYACEIDELNLHLTFCNTSSGCLNDTIIKYSNLSVSDRFIVNRAPSVDALTPQSTRVGGSSTQLILTGSSLPRVGNPIKIDFELTSIAGGPCEDPIDDYSIVSSTGTSMMILYTVSSNNDGCRIAMVGFSRAGVPASGAGVTTGTNVLRNFLGGNPVVSYGAPQVLNRTLVNVTLVGSSLPLGSAENSVVDLIPTGDRCASAGGAPIPCVLYAYGTLSIECTADLSLVLGDDITNGGCLLNARVTRLGVIGPTDSTSIYVPWYGEPPMDPPPMNPPVAEPLSPTSTTPNIGSTTPTSSSPLGGGGGAGVGTGDGNNQTGGGSNAALIGGVVGGILGALLLAAIIVGAVILAKTKAAEKKNRPKSIEMESPFEEPRYFTN